MNRNLNQINYGLIKEISLTIALCKNDKMIMIFLYWAYNEGKLVVAKRFIRTLKSKIYKTMAANDSKSHLSYLNKLVDEYNNTYHNSIGKKLIDADYFTLNEETDTSQKDSKFKVSDRVSITDYSNIFSKD